MGGSSREHRRASTLQLKVSLTYSTGELHSTYNPGIGGGKKILSHVRAVIKDLLILVHFTFTRNWRMKKGPALFYEHGFSTAAPQWYLTHSIKACGNT